MCVLRNAHREWDAEQCSTQRRGSGGGISEAAALQPNVSCNSCIGGHVRFGRCACSRQQGTQLAGGPACRHAVRTMGALPCRFFTARLGAHADWRFCRVAAGQYCVQTRSVTANGRAEPRLYGK